MAELKQYRMLIDGEWVDAEDGETFESVNPATGAAWATVPAAAEARWAHWPKSYPSP